MESRTTVAEVISHGSHAISVRFVRPVGFDYSPGQYMFISIGEGEQGITKHLSISSSPTDPYLEVTKRLTGHPFSNALASLAPGSSVVLRGPYGDFTFKGEYSKVAFLTGGIGISPMLSMMRFAIEQKSENDIVLIYSVRTESEIIFWSEILAMEGADPHFHAFVTLTEPGPDWKRHRGRVNREFIEQAVPDWKERVFFISGPPPMVDAMAGILGSMGVSGEQVHTEYFPGY